MSTYICPYGSDNSQSDDDMEDNEKLAPEGSPPRTKDEELSEKSSRSMSFSPPSVSSRASSVSVSPSHKKPPRDLADRGSQPERDNRPDRDSHSDRVSHTDRGKHSPYSRTKHRRSRSPDLRKKRSYSKERSPEYRKRDRRRRSKSPYYEKQKRSRSRDGRHYRDKYSSRRSRERSKTPPRTSSITNKPNKLSMLEKLGIDLKVANDKSFSVGTLPASYAEKIAKRKMLWSCNQKQVKEEAAEVKNPSVWQGTKFAQDQDGKMTAKFHRLMGMKSMPQDPDTPSATSSGASSSLLKKQEEMFSSMELQYEVARATTHTQRGVGLGFSSHYMTKQ